MDGLNDISRLNTVRNLLAGLTTAAICGTGAALLVVRHGAQNAESQAESVTVAIESSESAEDVVYLGQLPDRLRSLSTAEATRAVFRPAGLSQTVQEPGVASEPSAVSADEPIETQLFDPIETPQAANVPAAQAADDAVVQFEISEQTDTGTAEGVAVGREATVHLQAPATVSIPVNVTVNNGELLGQLESLKRQVEQLTRRLEASEAALAEARAAAASASTAVAVAPPVQSKTVVAPSAPPAPPVPVLRPSRPRIQRPPQPAGPVQIEYFSASGLAEERPRQPSVPEPVPSSPPPAVPEIAEPQAAVSVESVPDSATPLISDAPVLPELAPDTVGSATGAEEPVEQAVPVLPAEPVPPQTGLPRSSVPTASVVTAASVVAAPALVPGVPARTVSATRPAATDNAPELQYENWRDPGVPQQVPAWGGTVTRSPAASQSLVKRAVTNVREGVEETLDRLPTPDLRAPEWMRSMFRRATKSAGRSSGTGSGSGSGTAAAAAVVRDRGVIVRPASHLQPGPPRQGTVGAAAQQPSQRAGVR